MTWRCLRGYLAQHGITYPQYLQTAHWQDVKSRYWKSRLPKECYCCGKTGALELHHRTYRRVGSERLTDLILLCRACHAETHRIDRTRTVGCLWGAAKRHRKNRIQDGLPVGRPS